MSAPPDPWRAIDELWTEVEAIKARLGPGVGVVRLPATGYALRDFVRDAIVQALQMSDWRQTDAAGCCTSRHGCSPTGFGRSGFG